MAEQQPVTSLPADIAGRRILSTSQAAEYVGMSDKHWRLMHGRGETPRAKRIGERRLGWRLSDLDAWIDSREEKKAG